ncbi:MAG: hypothetical protein ACD_46C00431G0002 [uncultured bacterium]|nr:MAG: hypothetical protein ACD_46C00431G0002 [uncultured bacterium]
MRILYITPWFPNHTNDMAGSFVLDSINALKEIGHAVIVLVAHPYFIDA